MADENCDCPGGAPPAGGTPMADRSTKATGTASVYIIKELIPCLPPVDPSCSCGPGVVATSKGGTPDGAQGSYISNRSGYGNSEAIQVPSHGGPSTGPGQGGYNASRGGYGVPRGSYNTGQGGHGMVQGGYGRQSGHGAGYVEHGPVHGGQAHHGSYGTGHGGQGAHHGGYGTGHGGYTAGHGGYNAGRGGYNVGHGGAQQVGYTVQEGGGPVGGGGGGAGGGGPGDAGGGGPGDAGGGGHGPSGPSGAGGSSDHGSHFLPGFVPGRRTRFAPYGVTPGQPMGGWEKKGKPKLTVAEIITAVAIRLFILFAILGILHKFFDLCCLVSLLKARVKTISSYVMCFVCQAVKSVSSWFETGINAMSCASKAAASSSSGRSGCPRTYVAVRPCEATEKPSPHEVSLNAESNNFNDDEEDGVFQDGVFQTTRTNE